MNKLRNIIHLLYIQLLEEFIKKILFRKVILMKYVCNDSKQLNLIPNKIRSCFKNIVINYYNNHAVITVVFITNLFCSVIAFAIIARFSLFFDRRFGILIHNNFFKFIHQN